MKLKSAQPRTFSQLFEVLKDNITDVLLHFHPDSIKIRSADHAKTFIVYVNLHGNSLEEYVCAKYLPVAINMSRLWTVLKFAAADDILQMDSEEDKGDLDIRIIDSETNKVKFKTSYITYGELDEDALQFPENINFGSCISMSSTRLYGDLKQLESLEAQYVKLRQCKSPSGGNRLRLIGMGSSYHKEPYIDIDEGTITTGEGKTKSTGLVLRGDEEEASAGSLQEIEMVFPLKKLVQFTKAHCLDANVGIHLDEKGFLILQYNIKIYGELRFVVAATREDEDDQDESSLESDDDDEEGDEDASATTRKRGREEE